MFVFNSHSEEQTQSFARELAPRLKSGDVLALFGGLGMGKTAFVRGLAEGMGVTDEVSSPTFALVHEYSGKIPLYHFDMYRITTLGDLYMTGFFDYLDSNGILAVEWSENIESALPENAIKIEISRGEDENSRCISMSREI